jgi:hypothetical protein
MRMLRVDAEIGLLLMASRVGYFTALIQVGIAAGQRCEGCGGPD